MKHSYILKIGKEGGGGTMSTHNAAEIENVWEIGVSFIDWMTLKGCECVWMREKEIEIEEKETEPRAI